MFSGCRAAPPRRRGRRGGPVCVERRARCDRRRRWRVVAPLAERRAQALSIDQEQLQDLLGDADLRELLDADAIAEVEEQLQAVGESQRVRSVDGMHDLLLRLGDLSRAELEQRLARGPITEVGFTWTLAQLDKIRPYQG